MGESLPVRSLPPVKGQGCLTCRYVLIHWLLALYVDRIRFLFPCLALFSSPRRGLCREGQSPVSNR